MKLFFQICATLAVSTLFLSNCSSPTHSADEVCDAAPTVVTDTFRTPDLAMFELAGHVKSSVSTTYYNIHHTARGWEPDTANGMGRSVKIHFDTLGNYLARRYESVERDSLGRLTGWSDRRPNYHTLHGGFLKDTLRYTHCGNGVLESEGMSHYAVAVYDTLTNCITGQVTVPLSGEAGGDHSACFNICLAADSVGNWTERLTVWVTSSVGSRPHTSYALERRQISFYKQ